jgi:hypothetical protein
MKLWRLCNASAWPAGRPQNHRKAHIDSWLVLTPHITASDATAENPLHEILGCRISGCPRRTGTIHQIAGADDRTTQATIGRSDMSRKAGTGAARIAANAMQICN